MATDASAGSRLARGGMVRWELAGRPGAGAAIMALLGLVALVGLLGLGGCGPAQDGPQVATAGGRQSTSVSLGGVPATDPAERGRQFTACMRAEGIVLDDTGAGRGGPVVGGGQDATTVEAAMAKCRAYLPNGGEPEKLPADDIEMLRRYAECVREHGVPDYPDPDPQTGEVSLTEEQGRRLKSDPKLTAATQACQNLAPGADRAATPGIEVGG